MKFEGLSEAEVKKLQLQYGPNAMPAEKTIPAAGIFLAQFTNPLVYLLFGTGLISFFLQKYTDIIFIFSVVILNSLFGFFQEYKTQKTLSALQKLIKPNARVIRDSKRQEIEASQLVPGDIVFLAVGDRIPADGRILESALFFVNEAILTGESEAIEKKIKEEVFMGTIVSGGRAVMQLTKTGLATKIGGIAQSVKQTVQPLTTLQLRLQKFTRTLIFISIFLSALIFIFGILTKKDFWEMIQMSAVTLVAIIPEAMIIVITLILAIAMYKISKRKAFVRKLLAIETLGSTTVICTDKTGTLTEGKMMVDQIDFSNKYNGLLTISLCNDLSDTTEIALWDYLEKQKEFPYQKISDEYQRIFEIPFSSEYKFMATVNCSPTDKKKCFLLVKGAPEIVLKMSDLSKTQRELILKKIDEWAQKGLKVLGLASQKIAHNKAKEISIKKMPKLEWNGLIGLWDPPRLEVKEALQIAKRAGIKIKVVTGDHRATAEKMMNFLEMSVDPDEVLEGMDLEKLNDEKLKNKVEKTLLFTRVTPQQKLRIIRALQELGEIVAMAGDGVNDAPALKKSNIGIVVGSSSEVAKETADLILVDNDFNAIVAAIEEGRVVYENIKKAIFFMLSNSFAEVFLILGSIIFGWPLPLTIAQILWAHLLCDGPEDIVLGFEPKEKEVMIEGPKNINEPILNKGAIFLVFVISFLSGVFALSLFWYFGLHLGDIKLGQTMAFMAISFNSIFYIFSCRSFRKPFWRYENFWKNKWLFMSVAFSLTLMISISYLPLTQKLLNIVPLDFEDWSLLLTAAALIMLIIELTKSKLIMGKNKEN